MSETFDPPSLEALAVLLPGYEFEAFIAQGGMGAVYKARQRSLDRAVAIKILPPEFGADPEFHQSFETEAKAMARLNHPNLIAVYDYGDAGGMPYIVMEYVPGKSLFHSAHNRAVDAIQAVTIVKGICDGLAHAHEQGVIHRDIKPANILLTPKAEPKVGDFGLARPAGAGSTGLLMGTPGYTAPEIIQQPDHADRRSDIFALGVVLYELLIGRCPPYDTPPPPPSRVVGCDTALDAICAIATNPAAQKRYPSAEAMSAALDQWLRKAKSAPSARPGAPAAGAANAPGGGRPPARPPRPAGEPVPVVVPTRGRSNLPGLVILWSVLIAVSYFGWKKLSSLQKEKEAQEAAYYADKAKHRDAPPPELADPSPSRSTNARPSLPGESFPRDTSAAAGQGSGMRPDGELPEDEGRSARPSGKVVLPSAVVELEEKASSLVAELDAERSKDLASNAGNLGSELDVWIRGLNKGDQATWRPHVEKLKGLVNGDRVPTEAASVQGIKLSERMAKIADFCARKQISIDQAYTTKATKIRDAYVKRVTDASKGTDDAVKAALESRTEAAADLEEWLDWVRNR